MQAPRKASLTTRMNEGKILPKLIFAKTDAEFDQIWNDYQAKRESLGFAKVQEFRQKEYEENVKKLEEFLK